MKLYKVLTLGLLLSSSILSANTTMCFKENHKQMSTIESTKLSGGECKNLFSLNDMKNKGWSVDDIKISMNNGLYNFIYILKSVNKEKKQVPELNGNVDIVQLEKNIMKKLEEKQIKVKKEKIAKMIIVDKEKGKKLFESKCLACHGINGEKKMNYRSKILSQMSLEDIQFSIAQYTNDSKYGNGQQILMRPYAQNSSSSEIKLIYAYLKNIN